MLTIFKKKPKYTVAEIHHDFDTAEERLYKGAIDRFMTVCKKIGDDVRAHKDLLTRFGFVKAKAAADTVVEDKAMIDYIELYRMIYPGVKFITEEELKRLCKKYNLVYAPVDRYTGEVPMANLREIENAPALKFEHTINDQMFRKYHYDTSDDDSALPSQLAEFIRKPLLVPRAYESYSFSNNFYDLQKFWGYNGPLPEYTSSNWSVDQTIIRKSGLFIAAPKNLMDLKGLQRLNYFGYASIEKSKYIDPIVFRHVQGGLQIITKWGAEGEDEALKSQYSDQKN